MARGQEKEVCVGGLKFSCFTSAARVADNGQGCHSNPGIKGKVSHGSRMAVTSCLVDTHDDLSLFCTFIGAINKHTPI